MAFRYPCSLHWGHILLSFNRLLGTIVDNFFVVLVLYSSLLLSTCFYEYCISRTFGLVPPPFSSSSDLHWLSPIIPQFNIGTLDRGDWGLVRLHTIP